MNVMHGQQALVTAKLAPEGLVVLLNKDLKLHHLHVMIIIAMSCTAHLTVNMLDLVIMRLDLLTTWAMVTITRDPHQHHWVHMLVGEAESSHLNMMTTDTVIPGRIDMLIMEMNLNITVVSIMIEDSLAAEITRSYNCVC